MAEAVHPLRSQLRVPQPGSGQHRRLADPHLPPVQGELQAVVFELLRCARPNADRPGGLRLSLHLQGERGDSELTGSGGGELVVEHIAPIHLARGTAVDGGDDLAVVRSGAQSAHREAGDLFEVRCGDLVASRHRDPEAERLPDVHLGALHGRLHADVLGHHRRGGGGGQEQRQEGASHGACETACSHVLTSPAVPEAGEVGGGGGVRHWLLRRR